MSRILLYQAYGSEMMADYLQKFGYDVDNVSTEAVFSSLRSDKQDLWILDHFNENKPASLRLLAYARRYDADKPILMLSDLYDPHSIVAALDAGADDYMAKPCNMEEMVSRINALLRRRRTASRTILKSYTLGKYTFDTIECTLTCGEEVKRLNRQPGRLLAVLCSYMNEDVSNEVLIRSLYGEDNTKASPAGVYNSLALIRPALADEPRVQIVVRRNFGYRMVVTE